MKRKLLTATATLLAGLAQLSNAQQLPPEFPGMPAPCTQTRTLLIGDVDMFAAEIAQEQLVMPYDAVIEDGYGYYLKLHADDLADPAIAAFRSWLIGRFGALRSATARTSDRAAG